MQAILRAAIGVVLIQALVTPASGNPGRNLFEKQCADCHTIGKGDTGGPDLKGVAAKRQEAWLVQLITEPGKLTEAKNPIQLDLIKKYGYEMPNVGISHDEALKIVAFLKEADGAAKQPAAPEQPTQEQIKVTPELVARGKELFSGELSFAKGGAPCAACHPFRAPGITGGNLATDLTNHYEAMGEQGLRGALKSLRFPVMKEIFAERPLTDEEVAALVAFTRDAAVGKKDEPAAAFPLAGFGVFAGCLAVLMFYRRRIR